jgi:dephospho-coA kinase
MRHAIKIGLTGGIGSGKSMVSKLLTTYEIAVYDSDTRAKSLMEIDDKIIHSITQIFGKEAYTDGKLNRRFVAEEVFASSSKLLQINTIVHSAVIDDFSRWAELQAADILVFESAIIFENGLEKYFDKIIAVVAPQKLRIERVKRRSGLSRKEILNRIKNQTSSKTLRQRADYVVINDDRTAIIPQVERILKSI